MGINSKITNFINNKKFKIFIIYGMPIIMTIISVLIPFFPNLSNILVIVLIIIAVVNLLFIYYYHCLEDNKDETINNLSLNNEKKDKMISECFSLISFTDTYIKRISESVNKTANGIKNDGEVSLKIFDLDVYCEEICKECCKELCTKLNVELDSLSFSFSKIDDIDGKQFIYMAGHSNEFNRPSYYRKNKCVDDELKDYYVSDYLKKKKYKIDISSNSKEVNEKFKKHSSSEKYSQYIIYPLTCEDNKLIGIFQIITYDKVKLGNTKKDVEKLIRGHLLIFSSLIMLLYKTKKGLTAIPNNRSIK